MQLCQFDTLQTEVLDKLGFEDTFNGYRPELPALIYSLTATSIAASEIALGKIGKKLVEFISKVDLEHPDLPYAFNEIFGNDPKFIQEVAEVIELADRCKHLSSLSGSFHKLVDRNGFSKLFVQNDKYGTRLLKSWKNRDAIRASRKMQTVDLKAVYKKGAEIWNTKPTNFKIFNRHNIPYVDYIQLSERKIERYDELGCEVISDKLGDEIRQLKIHLSERYYGFNRVTVTVASVILAKMHGYRLKTSWDIHDNKNTSITIPYNSIYNFVPEDSELPAVFMPRIRGTGYLYEPRVYPLEIMRPLASESMLKVIDHMDCFPELNGKPLFDDFIILVPGVQLHNYGKYFIKDQKDNILGFDSHEEAALFLDRTLIKNGSITPILLGLRDSKCYFICYFK